MEKLKEFLMVDCYAFTAVTLFNAVLIATGNVKGEVSISFCLHIFLMTSIIAVLILITDEVCKNNPFIRLLFNLMDVIVPVLGYAFITESINLNFKTIMINIIVCILFYGLVYLLMLMSWREKDQKVNQSLEKMRAARKKKS